MKFFLYQMQSTDKAPNGGDFRSWLHFYKWGRPETVTFRKPTPHFEGAHRGDVIFFVLDGFLIGDARIEKVHNDVWIEGATGPIQEIDIAKDGIWEYTRRWTVFDKVRDWLLLRAFKEEVSQWVAWKIQSRFDGTDLLHGGHLNGRVAVYNPDIPPAFFGIKKK